MSKTAELLGKDAESLLSYKAKVDKATLHVPGIAHVILEVTDNGTPNLTSYRRIIVRSPATTSPAPAASR